MTNLTDTNYSKDTSNERDFFPEYEEHEARREDAPKYLPISSCVVITVTTTVVVLGFGVAAVIYFHLFR